MVVHVIVPTILLRETLGTMITVVFGVFQLKILCHLTCISCFPVRWSVDEEPTDLSSGHRWHTDRILGSYNVSDTEIPKTKGAHKIFSIFYISSFC